MNHPFFTRRANLYYVRIPWGAWHQLVTVPPQDIDAPDPLTGQEIFVWQAKHQRLVPIRLGTQVRYDARKGLVYSIRRDCQVCLRSYDEQESLYSDTCPPCARSQRLKEELERGKAAYEELMMM